jgi:hypothetical protein
MENDVLHSRQWEILCDCSVTSVAATCRLATDFAPCECLCHRPGAAFRSEQAAAPCQNCAAAEARAEAWRKAASDMLEVEIEARDKERLREHFRKTEALTRDAAASGRALHATAEDLAIIMRGRAQPAAGALEAFSTAPAASRSEQSAALPEAGTPSGVCAVCGYAAAYGINGVDFCAAHGPLASAAEAAQSPQVGAAPRLRSGTPLTWKLLYEETQSALVYAEKALRDAGDEHEAKAAQRVLDWLGEKDVALETAELGREGSDRPPVNPPVASADPELARLLREVRTEIAWWLEEHRCCRGHEGDLLARIDSALSRLAGQSATANASGGAARGSPEEER